MDEQREQIKQLTIAMPYALLRWVTLAEDNTTTMNSKLAFAKILSREPYRSQFGQVMRNAEPEVVSGLVRADSEALTDIFQTFASIAGTVTGNKESTLSFLKLHFDFAYDLALELAGLPEDASDTGLPDVQRLCLHALMDLFALSEHVTE